jgi:acyl carrier protein
MSNDIEQRLKKIFSVIFDVPEQSVDEFFSMESSENWDSMNQLNLVLSIEEEFGIYFSDTEVPTLISFKVVKDIVLSKVSN